MIKLMLTTQQTTGLVMQCDVCHALVRDESEAVVCWGDEQDDETRGHFFDYRIACSDRCLDVLDHRYGQQLTMEVAPAIAQLIVNTRIDIKQAQRTHALFKRSGLAS